MEVWGYNKFGDVQYFGYYKEEDFNNTSAKFKVAYYEYMKYFYEQKTNILMVYQADIKKQQKIYLKWKI